MSHPGFGHLWCDDELSDCDIVLYVDSSTLEDPHPVVLRTVPGQKSILTASPYCKAQVLRWQSHRFDGDGGGGYGGGFGALAGPDSKQQIKLTVADESWEAAAMAVLAVLYLLQPAAELLGELTQEQQVQAAVLGDMWDVPAAASAAVVHLAAAADGSDSEGLSAAALDRLVGMSAVPACLQSVLRSALLVKFGDLEATWSDAELRKELLQLPLSVMELLLSSDKLKVASEDTVLYTAQTYVDQLPENQREEAQGKLAPLVRCTYLSRFWLSAALLSDDAPKMLLSGLNRQLRHLFLAKHAAAAGDGGLTLTAAHIKEAVKEAPASWLLKPRLSKPVSSVQLDWRVDVADIKQAVVEVTSSLTKSQHVIRSPPSAPLLGVAWSMTLAVIFKEDRGGCMIALFVNARELPANTTLKAAYKVECVGHRAAYKRGQHVVSTWKTTVGTGDFFRCGPMCDGFDAQAWAAQGLPLDGQVELRLTVC